MNLDACVEAALRLLPAGMAERFSQNPSAVLSELGLSARAVDELTKHRDDGGACDGISFLEDGVILFVRTPASKRQYFTLAHEVGHWLLDQCDPELDWLADQPNAGKQLETVCDRVASQLLLPQGAVTDVRSGQPLAARHVMELFEFSHASRPACAIALARTLHELGAVVIIDAFAHVVTHSSVNPDPDRGWPHVFPWAGQPVPPGHQLKQLADQGHFAGRSFWATPWGAQQPYYIDARRAGRWVVAVFADTDAWGVERLHLDAPRTFIQRPEGEVFCCGAFQAARGFPCDTCDRHYCPKCGKCECDRQAQREVLCAGTCFMKYLPHLLVDGLCAQCRE